jgi:cyclopropane-fatty-acyl-phospholipid synthase
MSPSLGAPVRRQPEEMDSGRWPAMVEPAPAPLRAALAHLALRRAAKQAGICVRLPDGRSFGLPSGPVMTVTNRKAFYVRLGRDGKIGLGEAYMAGDWDSPSVVELLEAMARSVDTLIPQKLQWLRRMYESHHPQAEQNDRAGARRNIARHYDLSNELFAVFLDQSM